MFRVALILWFGIGSLTFATAAPTVREPIMIPLVAGQPEWLSFRPAPAIPPAPANPDRMGKALYDHEAGRLLELGGNQGLQDVAANKEILNAVRTEKERQQRDLLQKEADLKPPQELDANDKAWKAELEQQLKKGGDFDKIADDLNRRAQAFEAEAKAGDAAQTQAHRQIALLEGGGDGCGGSGCGGGGGSGGGGGGDGGGGLLGAALGAAMIGAAVGAMAAAGGGSEDDAAQKAFEERLAQQRQDAADQQEQSAIDASLAADARKLESERGVAAGSSDVTTLLTNLYNDSKSPSTLTSKAPPTANGVHVAVNYTTTRPAPRAALVDLQIVRCFRMPGRTVVACQRGLAQLCVNAAGDALPCP